MLEYSHELPKLKMRLHGLKCGSRGGERGSGPPPPGKSQVIWVSIGTKQLEKVGPPWKMLDPLWNLENDRFSLEIDHLTSV